MAKFKTDFKDEIVDKRTRQIINASTGTVIHNSVLVKNTYTPKQAGDKVGAAWFNDAGKRLNDLEDGTSLANTAKYANSLTGYKLIKFSYISGQASRINADGSYAWLNLPVGVQFAKCTALITPYMYPSTPYAQIYNVSTGSVSADGYFPIEVSGFGFVSAHTFSFTVLFVCAN